VSDRFSRPPRFLCPKPLVLDFTHHTDSVNDDNRRTEANQIYLLGQHRFAAPLERLKKRHQAFQARMLVAPPLSESPPPVVRSSATSRDARAVLGGASLPPAPSTSGAVSTSATSSAIPANGAKGFAVFQDTAVDANRIEGGSWEDLGTNKSRRRENEVEAVEWKGETMPMIAKKSGGGVGKLEVFRDDVRLFFNNPLLRSFD
jgi:checkpoint serine/threonine-protein kinase